MPQQDIDSLIAQLDTQSDNAADEIIARIVPMGKEAVPILIKASKNSEQPRIRKWSLQALGAIGDKRAVPVLIDALGDKQMTIRLHAVKGLARMKSKRGVNEIAELLEDESGGVRVNTISTLTEIGDASVAPQIQKCLDDEKWYVRKAACAACGALKLDQAKGKLKKLAESDDRKAVREAAAQALSVLNQA